MKKIMQSLFAVMCLVGFSSLSFAEDMGKMKEEMKGDMKGHNDEMKGEMKGKMDGKKGKKDEMMMKGDMKAKPDEMKGEMMEKKGEMEPLLKKAFGE